MSLFVHDKVDEKIRGNIFSSPFQYPRPTFTHFLLFSTPLPLSTCNSQEVFTAGTKIHDSEQDRTRGWSPSKWNVGTRKEAFHKPYNAIKENTYMDRCLTLKLILRLYRGKVHFPHTNYLTTKYVCLPPKNLHKQGRDFSGYLVRKEFGLIIGIYGAARSSYLEKRHRHHGEINSGGHKMQEFKNCQSANLN